MFTVQALESGDIKLVANEASTAKSVLVEFAAGVDVEVGRGATDTDRTYIALRNSAGTKYYVYIDTTSLLASTTKP